MDDQDNRRVPWWVALVAKPMTVPMIVFLLFLLAAVDSGLTYLRSILQAWGLL